MRWQEEVDLLEEEMRRISQFLRWRSEWWSGKVDRRGLGKGLNGRENRLRNTPGKHPSHVSRRVCEGVGGATGAYREGEGRGSTTTSSSPQCRHPKIDFDEYYVTFWLTMNDDDDDL
ncbi:hypothetical protein B0H12DRAFT_1076912 [Mycena haematopus]|nr:hypothetical protein B0H12DRAFT_1076912 [Mycena haematopus]